MCSLIPSTERGLDFRLSIRRDETWAPVERGEPWVDENGRLWARSSWHRGEGRVEIPGTGVFFILADSSEVRVLVEQDVTPERVRRDFRHIALPLLAQARGWQILHASAVLTGRGVVGFCGRSGSGKSTMARAWAKDGREPWADDSLTFRVGPAGPLTARLAELGSSKTIETRPLAGVVVLEANSRRRGSPDLERLRATAALEAVLPHALCFDSTDPTLAGSLFTAYGELARLPVYRLRYRQTPRAPREVVALLEELLAHPR